MTAKVELPAEIVAKLADLPEQGMGYQIVDITLQNGDVLKNRRVLNATFLLLQNIESFGTADIENAVLHK